MVDINKTSHGPRTEPCGTLDTTEVVVDEAQHIAIYEAVRQT